MGVQLFDAYQNRFRLWLYCWLNIDYIAKSVRTNEKIVCAVDARTRDLVHIGVDVHFKSPHMILIYSKLKGGQLRHIDVDLKDMNHLHTAVREIKQRYGTRKEIWDTPHHWDINKML